MQLRQATIQDIDLIKQIHRESSKEIGSFNLFYVWDNYISGKSSYKFYVLGDCSFVRYGYSAKYKANVVFEIGVLKSSRGKGYAKMIIDQLDKPLVLKCNIDNVGGNLFYERIGMRKIGTAKSMNKKKTMNVWAIL